MNQVFKDVFISYGRRESIAFVARLYKALKLRGYEVWFDKVNIPHANMWRKAIYDGISNAQSFVFVIAPHSLRSHNCRDEILYALKHGKRIIPIVHVEEKEEGAWREVPQIIGELDWIHAREKVGDLASLENWMQSKQAEWARFDEVDNLADWDFPQWEAIDSFDEAMQNLIDAIENKKDYVYQHTQILNQALIWERNLRQSADLLYGEARMKAEQWLRTKPQGTEQLPCTPSALHGEFICASIKNANNLMSDVFLGFSEEEHIRNQVDSFLQRNGITTWKHKRDIPKGTNYVEAINKGIIESDNFFFFLSHSSIHSNRYSLRELNVALQYQKRIIPIRITDVADDEIPSEIKEFFYIDFAGFDDRDWKKLPFSQLGKEILQLLQENRDYHFRHKLFLTQALKWEEQGENDSILLRSADLKVAERWLEMGELQIYQPLDLHRRFIDASQENALQETNAEVFISYSERDSDFARKLNHELQVRGRSTWFDQESIAAASNSRQEKLKGVESSDNFAFLLSRNSVEADNCLEEIARAREMNKRVIVLLLQPMPREEWPVVLQDIEPIGFTGNANQFAHAFTEFIRALEHDRIYVNRHNRWQQKAMDWNLNDRHPDFLLGELECWQAENWLKLADEMSKKPKPTELHREYILNSRHELDKLKQAEQERQQRVLDLEKQRTQEVEKRLQVQEQVMEKEQRVKRAYLIGFLASLTLMAVALYFFLTTWQQKQEINAQKEEARNQALANKLMSTALKEAENDPTFGIQLMRKAVERAPENPFINGMLYDFYDQYSFYKQSFTNADPTNPISAILPMNDQTLLVGLSNGQVKTWDLASGQFVDQGDTLINGSVKLMRRSAAHLAIATNHRIKIFALDSAGKPGEVILDQTYQASLMDAVFAPDGQIAIGLESGQLELRNLALPRTRPLFAMLHEPIQQLRFTRTGGQDLLMAISAHKLVNWQYFGERPAAPLVRKPSLLDDTESGLSSMLLPKDTTHVYGMANGKILVTNYNRKIRMKLQVQAAAVRDLVLLKPSKVLATVGDLPAIKLWDAQTGSPIAQLQGHQHPIRQLSQTPNGQYLLSLDATGSVKVWDIAHNLKGAMAGQSSFSHPFHLTASGQFLLTSHEVIRFPEKTRTPINVYLDPNLPACISEDGQRLMFINGQAIVVTDLVGNRIHNIKSHEGKITDLAANANGLMASSGTDSLVYIWNLESGSVMTTIRHTAGVTALAWSDDGNALATATEHGWLQVWARDPNDPAHWPLKDQPRSLLAQPITAVAFAPGSNAKVFVGFERGEILLAQVVASSPGYYELPGHNGPVVGFHALADGDAIISYGRDGEARLWDTKGNLHHTFRTRHTETGLAGFLPDGRIMQIARNGQAQHYRPYPILHALTWQNQIAQASFIDFLRVSAFEEEELSNFLKEEATPEDFLSLAQFYFGKGEYQQGESSVGYYQDAIAYYEDYFEKNQSEKIPVQIYLNHAKAQLKVGMNIDEEAILEINSPDDKALVAKFFEEAADIVASPAKSREFLENAYRLAKASYLFTPNVPIGKLLIRTADRLGAPFPQDVLQTNPNLAQFIPLITYLGQQIGMTELPNAAQREHWHSLAEAHFERMKRQYDRSTFEASYRAYARLAADVPTTEDKIYCRELARQYLETLMENHPDEADYQQNLAQTYGIMAHYFNFADQHEQSVAYAKKGLELSPDASWIQTKMAWAYLYQQEYGKAAAIFRRFASDTVFRLTYWDDIYRLVEIGLPDSTHVFTSLIAAHGDTVWQESGAVTALKFYHESAKSARNKEEFTRFAAEAVEYAAFLQAQFPDKYQDLFMRIVDPLGHPRFLKWSIPLVEGLPDAEENPWTQLYLAGAYGLTGDMAKAKTLLATVSQVDFKGKNARQYLMDKIELAESSGELTQIIKKNELSAIEREKLLDRLEEMKRFLRQ